ncbi:hypothetical protein A2U01_0112488, partial [Trifolium medium]|nr:hypothetical protein [Trifolium medium]
MRLRNMVFTMLQMMNNKPIIPCVVCNSPDLVR